MRSEVEQHIAIVEAFYEPIILGPNSRLGGGARLWSQFEAAREAYRRGTTVFRPVYERINEMAAAHVLLSDSSLNGATVSYEVPIAAGGSLIDFTVSLPDGRTQYAEVKTVHPNTQDSEASWANYEKRSARHPREVKYIVDKEWLGGELYGNSFSARSSFMRYAQEFEERLAAANEVRPGEGALVFCGTGFEWHLSELEDFADFYMVGVHREDDPFAQMEVHALVERRIELRRNISEFAYVKRPMDSVGPEKWLAKVRGPQQGRGRPKRSGPGNAK